MDRKPGSRENKDGVYSILTIPIVMDKIFRIEKKIFSPKTLIFLIRQPGNRKYEKAGYNFGEKRSRSEMDLSISWDCFPVLEGESGLTMIRMDFRISNLSRTWSSRY